MTNTAIDSSRHGFMGGRKISRITSAIISIATCGVISTMAAADASPPTQGPERVHELIAKDLAGVPGKELRMLTVEYVPGGASLPHRHNAQVFVYVLSGSVRMQVEGSPAVTLGPGQTFYEGRDDIHKVSANASHDKPATILVFMVKDKDAPASIDVAARQGK